MTGRNGSATSLAAIGAMVAGVVFAAAALVRWIVLETVDGRHPFGTIDLVVLPHYAAFWVAVGFDFEI